MDVLKPLEGVTVVDLTHLLAGPFCTMLLADAGATVLKIEPPVGEISRHRFPFYETDSGDRVSAYFAAVNRGKRSIALDLKSEVGMRALDQLFEGADVIVMNYREQALRRLGIQPERLRSRFPKAVIASITAFGRQPNSPETSRPGLAIVAEAFSGITGLSQGDTDAPTWVGFALGDFVSGQTAFGAISAALVKSLKTGDGCYLDLSMTDALLAFNGIDLVRHQAAADTPSGRSSPVPYGVFPAADGHVVIGCNSDEFWRRLRIAMDPGEVDHSLDRFATALTRMEHRGEVIARVSEWTRSATRDKVVEQLVEAGIPCGPVNSGGDVLSLQFLRDRGSLRDVAFAGSRFAVPHGSLGMAAADPQLVPELPQLGEHTETVLRARTTLSDEEIDQVLRQGAATATPKAQFGT